MCVGDESEDYKANFESIVSVLSLSHAHSKIDVKRTLDVVLGMSSNMTWQIAEELTRCCLILSDLGNRNPINVAYDIKTAVRRVFNEGPT